MKRFLVVLAFALPMILAGHAHAEMDDHGDFAPEACAPISKQWSGTDNNDIQLDARRWIRNRVSWRVTLCGTSVTHVQTYLAVSCELDDNPYPCSFGWSVKAKHQGDSPYEDRTNYNSNTGSDGFASTYGPAHSVPSGHCVDHQMTGVIRDVGIAGKVFDMSNANNPDDFNRCV